MRGVVDLNPQAASVAGSGKGGTAPAGQGEDGGAFDALLNDLAVDRPSRRPSEQRGKGGAGSEGAEAADGSSRGRIASRLSAILDGETAVRDGMPVTAEEDTPHTEKEKAAARLLAERARGLHGKTMQGGVGQGRGLDGAEAEGKVRHGPPGRSSDEADPSLATDPRFQQTGTDTAAQAIPLLAQAAASIAAAPVQETAGRGRGAPAQAQSGDASPEAESGGDGSIGIKVLNRETHFAPVGQSSTPPSESFSLPDAADRQSGKDAVAAEAGAKDGVELRVAERREEGAQRTASANARSETGGIQAETLQPASGNTQAGSPGGMHTLPLSNLRQVSEAISAEVARMATPMSGLAAETLRGQGPVRLLDIQLHPAELGVVTVRLRISQNGLEVKLHASKPETARLLKQDQAQLTELLRSQGIEGADVSVVDGADAGGAWTRFEAPRQVLASATTAREGDEQRSSDQRQGGGSSRNGRNEDETSSGRRDRSGSDRG